jgi:Rrf2 family transcriptional regulator, iron-sulfur cluster assembly transcription factor
MMLTTKGRYAVMAMVELAMQGDARPMTLSLISERQEISVPYLEQIFALLKTRGLVRSVRGPGGGYVLAVQANDMTIADIVAAVEEPVKMTRCYEASSGCMSKSTKCVTHDLWDGLEQTIWSYFRSIRLADMLTQVAVSHDGLSLKACGREAML